MKTFIRWALCGALVATLSACGGSSSSGGPGSSAAASSSSGQSTSSVVAPSSSAEGSSSSAPDAVFTGVFIDSAVIGIGYRTTPGGHEGVTNSEGEYQFAVGDEVTFFIGELTLPSVQAKGVVTPLDLAGTDDEDDPTLINIIRLLQSLDEDGDPDNGITIPTGAAAVATAINFEQSVEDFAADAAVTNLVANSGNQTTTLVSSEQALEHLRNSLHQLRLSLIGTWYYQDDTHPETTHQFHIAMTFLDETRFTLITDENDDDDAGTDGFESGTYEWNLQTGEIIFTALRDTNGAWGTSNPCSDQQQRFLEIRGGSIHINIVNPPGDPDENCIELFNGTNQVVFERIVTEQDSLVGTWYTEGDEEFLIVMIFTEDGYYLMLEDRASDDDGSPGIERGTYTYDPESGEVSFVTQTDTNGQWGVSHPCAVLSLDGVNQVSCGPEGADIVQTLTVEGNMLTYINEAETLAAGEESPFVLWWVQPAVR